jgi:hypothetical protein
LSVLSRSPVISGVSTVAALSAHSESNSTSFVTSVTTRSSVLTLNFHGAFVAFTLLISHPASIPDPSHSSVVTLPCTVPLAITCAVTMTCFLHSKPASTVVNVSVPVRWISVPELTVFPVLDVVQPACPLRGGRDGEQDRGQSRAEEQQRLPGLHLGAFLRLAAAGLERGSLV